MHEALERALNSVSKEIADNSSFVPTSFDPSDSALAGFPRSLEWRWRSAEHALGVIHPRVILMRLPLFWQVEMPLWRAGQSSGASIFVNEPENMPVGKSAILSGCADVVVTDTRDALAFSAYLASERVSLPRGWILAHETTGTRWDVPAALKNDEMIVFQEVHLFPGYPVLEQCVALASKKASRFHAPDSCVITVDEAGTALFSSPATDPLPLARLPLPFRLSVKEACPCGKETFEPAQ